MHARFINRARIFGSILLWSAFIDHTVNQTQSDFLYSGKKGYLEILINRKRE